jgi:hypothetical protein
MDNEEQLDKLRELELAAAQQTVPLWVKIAVGILVLALMSAAAVAGYHWLKHEQAVVMTELQIQQTDELAKRLDISQAQAAKLAAELAKVKAENREPEIKYIVQAPTVEKAAEQVKRDINAGKSPANKIPADKTVVTPNQTEQKVDVYRITLDKAKWGVSGLVLAGGTEAMELGAGISYTNKDWGADAGYTSKNRAYLLSRFYPKFLNQ